MIKSIRNLIGTTAEWAAAADFVVPNGELALERRTDGTVTVKIGDGATEYGKLRFANKPTVISDGQKTITVTDGAIYRIGTADYLSITFPTTAESDYYCEVSFTSGVDATELAITGPAVRMSGDDVADEVFLPKAKMHYTMWFWYDGDWHGIVRGIPNA